MDRRYNTLSSSRHHFDSFLPASITVLSAFSNGYTDIPTSLLLCGHYLLNLILVGKRIGPSVSVTFLHLLAICSAIYRLAHRFRMRRAWWDDYVAFIPLVLDAAYCSLFWVRFPNRGAMTSHVYASYWLSITPFLLILWVSRIALSLSLTRLFPQKHAARLWSFFLVVIMVLSLISCLLVSALTCHQSSAPLIAGETACKKGANGSTVRSLYLFAEDLVGDALLVLSPIVLFWRLKLPRGERTLVLTIFSGSVLTLMAAVVFTILDNGHVVSLGPDSKIIIAGLQNIEVAISLFVCNLAVVSTCFYQAILRYFDLERPELESTEETPRDYSRQCTCSDQAPTPLTLTEISISNFFGSERSGLPDSSGGTSRPTHVSSPLSSGEPPMPLSKKFEELIY